MGVKRKRESSPNREDLVSQPSALTASHLAAFNAIMPPRSKPSVKPSASSESALSSARSQLTNVLDTYGMAQDRHREMPSALQTLVNFVKTERYGDLTPKSKQIARMAKETANMKEAAAIDELEGLLGYKHELAEGGERYIFRGREDTWRADSVPKPDASKDDLLTAALVAVGSPPTPRPDVTYGYSTATFSRREHKIMKLFPVEAFPTNYEAPLFPYSVMEWKAHKTGGNIWQAERQALRDGAAAVNAMWRFFGAVSDNPPVEDTAVFSTCVSSTEVVVRIHWRNIEDDEIMWEADEVARGLLSRAKDVFEVRSVILKVLEWARETRLPHIKSALTQREKKETEASTDAVNVQPITPTSSVTQNQESDGTTNKKRRVEVEDSGAE